MCIPALGDLSPVEHDDLVGVADRRQPVRDRDRGAARREGVDGLLHGLLGLRVQGAGRLVEDEDGRVPQDGAGDRQALLLAAGEAVAALPHHGVVAVGQRHEVVVDLRDPGGRDELVIGRGRLGEPQVVGHRGVEEVGLLGDDADRGRQRVERHVPHVGAVDRDTAGRHVVQARDEVAEGGLARTCLADDRQAMAGRDGHVDVAQGRPRRCPRSGSPRRAGAPRRAPSPSAPGATARRCRRAGPGTRRCGRTAPASSACPRRC